MSHIVLKFTVVLGLQSTVIHEHTSYTHTYTHPVQSMSLGHGIHTMCKHACIYTHPVLVELTVSNETVNEGDELRVRCSNMNLQGLSITYWLDSHGQNITSNPQSELFIRNVSRNYTGAYTCVIASTRDNSTVTKPAYVTIQCKCCIVVYTVSALATTLA